MRRRGGPPDAQGGIGAVGAGAMAAGGDIIGSSTHVGDVYEAVPLPRADDVDPPRGMRPALPSRTRMFVGRTGKLAELDDAPGGAVVHGLGGVGKSTLAAHWAHQHADDHVLTWWITADSEAAITAGLADLAGMLVPEMTRGTPAAVPLEERAAWARRWLASHSGWLVVLDNVTHPSHVAGLVAGATGGRFLITSRLREGWHDIVPTLIELDVLSEPEALELMRGIVTAGRPAGALDGGAELCGELGYLPLAVQQAGAYMSQTHLTPAAYLDRLRDNPDVMYDRAARGGDAERTIARIWRVTLDALADTPLAGQLLRTMAWWAPDDIPRTLLDPSADALDVDDALGALAAYSMINLDGEAVTVHRLVQAVARTPDPDDPHRHPTDIDQARDQAAGLLNASIPADSSVPADWPWWRTLVPHIDALTGYTSPATSDATIALLLDKTGLFLSDQGDCARAIAYHQRAVTISERRLGADHVNTLVSRNGLARAYESAGDLTRAIPSFEQVLADFERVLGPDDPSTLALRNDLARGYMLDGKVARAVPLYKQLLKDFERTLGPDHPNTLTARHNLARGYMAAGNTSRAMPLAEQVVADFERTLGPDDPNTLSARYSLAHVYQSAGALADAVPLFEQNLAARERVLGTDHPTTLGSRNSLARTYLMVGDLARAIPLFKETLKARERVLGRDHPSTLGSRNNMAHAYETVGNLTQAISLYEQTLADCERVLGTDHHFTRVVRKNLEAARKQV